MNHRAGTIAHAAAETEVELMIAQLQEQREAAQLRAFREKLPPHVYSKSPEITRLAAHHAKLRTRVNNLAKRANDNSDARDTLAEARLTRMHMYVQREVLNDTTAYLTMIEEAEQLGEEQYEVNAGKAQVERALATDRNPATAKMTDEDLARELDDCVALDTVDLDPPLPVPPLSAMPSTRAPAMARFNPAAPIRVHAPVY